MNRYRIRVVDEFQSLELQAIWASLELPSPMQSYAWLSTWWRHYQGQGRSLFLVIVEDQNGRVQAVAPFYRNHRKFLDELRFLGDGQVCSDYGTILFTAEGRASHVDLLPEFLGWLHRILESERMQLALESVPSQDSVMAMWHAKLFKDARFESRIVPAVGCCAVELPSSFEDYLATLSKNHRKRCRNWKRRYLDTGRAEVKEFNASSSMTEVNAALRSLRTMSQERRTALHGECVFEEKPFFEFHADAARRMIKSGLARLQLLSIDQRPAAMEYMLESEECIYAYQSGLNEHGMQHSAGNISILAMVMAAIESGKIRFDLLRGVEAYKSHWGAKHVPAIDLYTRSRSPATTLLSGAQRSLYATQRLCGIS